MRAPLEDIPEGALPGGDNAGALLEMMPGTFAPAARGAGEVDCRKGTALVASIRDRILADLAAAADRGPEPGEPGRAGD